jgi:hypothetical protein
MIVVASFAPAHDLTFVCVLSHFFSHCVPAVCDFWVVFLVHLSPFLRSGKLSASTTVSRLQIACVLALTFFCLHPFADPNVCDHPNLDLRLLYSKCTPVSKAKLECLLNYFDRLAVNGVPLGNVTFYRNVTTIPDTQTLSDQRFKGDATVLCDVNFVEQSTVFDHAEALQFITAQPHIGSTVLKDGCSQEDTTLALHPEALVALLLIEKLEARDSLSIIGAERFNNFRDTGKDFVFTGDYCQPAMVLDSLCASWFALCFCSCCGFLLNLSVRSYLIPLHYTSNLYAHTHETTNTHIRTYALTIFDLCANRVHRFLR